MQRSQAMALVIAAGAALSITGCDRPAANPAASVGIQSETGVFKLAQQSADEPNEKSSAPDQLGDLMDDSADTGDKSAHTSASEAADTTANMVASVGDDAAVNSKVASALAADLSLKAADIKVDTKGGTVTLSGNVDTPSLRLHAKEVAARQQGVVNVIDHMAVASRG